ncbi:PQQ-dependent dehydrogenase, methanol/ethanol family [Sphingobium phenoxybenzoativorans]|uniref:PQQ-dependent dehydrogenase, methanol/ethanol family n=1 Tax=Sphingobium phenoxybenzoativorans TaxID=1592790 RepID=A0A975K5I5_9SPHN|nr:PQQ-dependent dehydrogenase, methanol/ethanol family [Sphingobium phenoxybenzoativorans]QUT04729.1 PQQ-dependent dehydrogenase, methanol/ethanol family [Sphingobium phenoxybenzoativorans]
MGKSRWILASAFVAIVVATASCAPRQAEVSSPARDRLAEAASEPQNWLTHGGTYDEQRFSSLASINATNIGQLGLAWFHDLGTTRGLEATPLVVDGVMYVTMPWSKVVALDAETGREIWTYDPQVPGSFGVSACCDVVNRGAAYHDGRVFVGTIDGRLIALDAKSGTLVWSVQTTDRDKPYTITGAPRVARGKVYIGNGGAEYGVRGYVSAYDEKTGQLAWRFYTVPGDPSKPDNAASDAIMAKLGRATWFGDAYWKFGGGGTVWDSIVYDPDLNRLYIGVGNGGPWNRKIRSEDKGDNLFLGSVVALDPDTGAYIWHYQETPGDTWDFTSTQQITLATLRIEGRDRKVIMHAPKNGFFYVIDRETGKLISADKFVPVNWAEKVDLATGRPVESEGARFQDKPFLANSGASGAHNWHPMAYSPATGLMYIPAQQVPFLYVKDSKFRYQPGLWALGVDMMSTPLPQTPAEIAAMKQALQGRLIAWDPVARKEVWRAPHSGTWNGGILATAGNLVFQGLSDATFRAYQADNGKELWKFDAQTPILPGAISYSVKGTQYVAIAAGNGGGFALSLPAFDGPRPRPTGRVLVFKLDGNAKLPPVEGGVMDANPSSDRFTQAQVEEGNQLFGQICAACHGMGTISGGIVPDLRRSGALADKDMWQQIVIGGALESQGMVGFAKYLSPQQAETIRGYVSAQADKLKAKGKE